MLTTEQDDDEDGLMLTYLKPAHTTALHGHRENAG